MRAVTVTPVLNGFIVNVGCQHLIFNTIEEVAAELVRYQKEPQKVELEYRKKAVNDTLGDVPQASPGNLLPPIQQRQQAGVVTSATRAMPETRRTTLGEDQRAESPC